MNTLSQYLKREVQKIDTQAFAQPTQDRWRTGYHLMPPTGWLNDPNGLCFYKGEYHIFFQYAPFDAEGGLKFWGHYKTADFCHWDYVGVPLVTDQPFDLHGVYSGSALVEGDTMSLFYTGNVKFDGDYDYITAGRGAYTILTSSQDGIHFGTKQCLLSNGDYPDHVSCHVRDPKVWKEQDTYYMILGARTKENKGEVLFYTSSDKQHWTFSKTLTTKEPFGYMWECPDYFNLEDKTILSVSPQGLTQKGRLYQNLYQSGYFIVESETQEYIDETTFQEWDKGFDFYAPQTFLDDKGRRILIGWMGMPDVTEDYTNPTTEKGWQHVLTMPRQVTYHNGILYQQPLPELEQQRGEELPFTDQLSLPPSFILELENQTDADFSITLDGDAVMTFHKEKGYFELSFSGAMGAGRKSRSVDLINCQKAVLYADTSALELYLNDGEIVFSTRYYPQNDEVVVSYEGENTNCRVWHRTPDTIRRAFS